MMRRLMISVLLGGLAACESPAGEGPEIELLEPQELAVGVQSADPSMAIDPESGDLLLAWVAEVGGEWALFHARSGDAGGLFSEPVRVNDVDGDVFPHAEGAPRLVAAPGVIALFWSNQFSVPNRTFSASDLRFSRSIDGGRSWEAARTLQDGSEGVIPGANTFHGAAWDGGSGLVVAWLDGRDRDARRIARGVASGVSQEEAGSDPERFSDESDPHDGDATVFAAWSHDLGESWEPANRRIQGSTCPCCRVTLAASPDGEVYGSWRGHFGENFRDPAFHRLDGEEDGAVRIHADNWEYPGCPHSGPAIAFGNDGTVHSAWYTGAEGRMGVHYASKAPGDDAFSAPVPVATGAAIPVAHPSVVSLGDGSAVVAHNVDATGRRVIVLTHLSDDGSILSSVEVPDSEGGTHPQTVVLPDGRVVVAWTQSQAGQTRVRLARLDPGVGS